MSLKVGTRTFADADQLEKLVIHAAAEYEANGYVEDFDGIEVTDPEYDELVRSLRQHKPTSKALKGASPAAAAAPAPTTGKTVKHDPPLTSISKADGEETDKQGIYEKWLADCGTRLGRPITADDVAQEYKHDGNCVRINYVKGKLVSAGTRNRDGTSGTDITEHVKHIKGVFLKLPLPLTLSLNGEVECWIKDFEGINDARDSIGEEPYKNPRNYTAGVLGRDDPDEVKDAGLRISYHSISGFDDWEKYYKTVIERAKWANSPDGLNLQDDKGKGYFVRSMPHKFHQLRIMEDKAKDMPYYVDGVVLKINDLESYDELGHSGDDTTNPPRAALAWKFAEEEKQAVCAELEWNASRTGRVVPTAIFTAPIRLADTDVTRATCNNYGWATKMGVGKGTTVLVKKAGKIIPNVCGVVKDAVKDIGAPKKCPTCDSKLELFTSGSGNTDLLCKNDQCGAKQVRAWLFYITQLGGKGLGASAMGKVLHTGKVKTLACLYDLTVDDLVKAGFSDRQATLALATIFLLPPDKDNDALKDKIEAARKTKAKVEAWRFFKALGISGAGESAGKALFKHFGDFDKIRTANSAKLQQVPGIGVATADAIEDYFADRADTVDALLERIELELPKSGKLNGKSFCLTGSFDEGKKYWQQQIEDQGGNCVSSVGKDTSYLLMQHGKSDGSPSDKEQKAAKYGTQVISVDDLKKML
jgi:DNA ligase (NAD+)